jgi:hypothetical protein
LDVWKEKEARVMRQTISSMILEEMLAEEDILERLNTQLDLHYSRDEVIELGHVQR